MLRLSGPVCPFCAVISHQIPVQQSWQSSRSLTTLAKRKPSRMILSQKVRQGPRRTEDGKSPAKRKSGNSPFAAMNTTKVPLDLQRQRLRTKGNVEMAPKVEAKTSFRTQKQEKRSQKEDMPALKMQKRLADVSYDKRARLKEKLASLDDFSLFDLLPVIKEAIPKTALNGLIDIVPTPVQRLAIPALLDRDTRSRKTKERSNRQTMQQYLLAAETGSGKTLAYTLPIIDAIKRAEAAERREAELERQRVLHGKSTTNYEPNQLPSPPKEDAKTSKARPRALILLPTAELVAQVGAVIKSLSHHIKFRTAIISSAFSPTVIKSRLFSAGGVDVVVSTPHLLNSITDSDPNILSRVEYLVIDEADSLLDRSFSETTSSIIDRATPSLRQLIMCSATIPRSLDSYINKRYPETHRLATPNLHAIPRRVQLTVVDVDKIPYQGNRQLACAQVVWDIGKEGAEQGEEERSKKVIVFVNERETATSLTEFLVKKGVDAHCFSRDSDARQNEEILAMFTSRPTASTDKKPSAVATTESSPAEKEALADPGQARFELTQEKKDSNLQVLVTTDIASRGIDTTPVRHVVLYDVPHTSIDFIHRLGRLGRMNRRGRGIVLVGRHDRKDVVREVREGMFKGSALI